MTLRHCAFSGCSKTVEHDDADLWPPEGWQHIWTSGDDPRIGALREGWYCAARPSGRVRALGYAYAWDGKRRVAALQRRQDEGRRERSAGGRGGVPVAHLR